MRNKKFYSSCICVFLAICYLVTMLVADEQRKTTKFTEEAKVISVIDGDTVKVSVTKEYKIRLIDCWAPEITGKNKEAGLKSKQYLESLIKAGDVVIIEIPTTNRFEDSISLDRMLGYVWKDTNNDGSHENISDLIVRSGYATKTKPK